MVKRQVQALSWTTAGHTGETVNQPLTEDAKHDLCRAMSSVRTPPRVRLADIVEQRSAQNVFIVTRSLTQKIVDAQMMGAVERREALEE